MPQVYMCLIFPLLNQRMSYFHAYETVLDAERVSANVSVLLQDLNVASNYLADANIFYRLGDFDNASNFSNLCYEIATRVEKEALELQNEAVRLNEANFEATVFLSFVGVLFVVIFGFLSWRIFKSRYYRQVLGSKPEVVADES